MRSVLLADRGGFGRVRPVSRLYVWGPVLVAVAVIAVESTRTFSAENTSGWLRPVFEAVLGRISDPHWAQMHHLMRKSGHFGGFGAVCVTFVRAWLLRAMTRAAVSVSRWRWGASLRAVASTALIASMDEFHQTFLPNRTGKVSDVVLDTCGAVVACGVLWLLCWRRDDETS